MAPSSHPPAGLVQEALLQSREPRTTSKIWPPTAGITSPLTMPCGRSAEMTPPCARSSGVSRTAGASRARCARSTRRGRAKCLTSLDVLSQCMVDVGLISAAAASPLLEPSHYICIQPKRDLLLRAARATADRQDLGAAGAAGSVKRRRARRQPDLRRGGAAASELRGAGDAAAADGVVRGCGRRAGR